MDINTIQENGKVVITPVIAPNGRLDFIASESGQLQNEVNAALDIAEEVRLDFSHISHISSAGLRVLLAIQKSAKSKGVPLVIFNVTNEAMKIIKMTGFDQKISIEK